MMPIRATSAFVLNHCNRSQGSELMKREQYLFADAVELAFSESPSPHLGVHVARGCEIELELLHEDR
jgi:hypothetical protein